MQRAGELQEIPGIGDNWRSWIYEAKHMYKKAIDSDLRDVAGMGFPVADINSLRCAYTSNGWRGYWKARIKLDLHRAKNQCVSYMLAVSYVRIGEPANAFY